MINHKQGKYGLKKIQILFICHIGAIFSVNFYCAQQAETHNNLDRNCNFCLCLKLAFIASFYNKITNNVSQGLERGHMCR
jgi:hypothetical protein